MIIALENIRSLHNIGAIIRTAEFFGIKNIALIGYSGVEHAYSDENTKKVLTHSKLIKTSLGAIEKVNIEHYENIKDLNLKYPDYPIIAIEQSKNSIKLKDWAPKSDNFIVVLGNEVDGVEAETLKLSEQIVEIERIGTHKSLNVASTAAIVIYHVVGFDKSKNGFPPSRE